MNKNKKPTSSNFTVLHQIYNLIPTNLTQKLARELGVDNQSRIFSPWSHVVCMLYAQLTHAIGLNDVCDGLRFHSGLLSAIHGTTPPSRNGLSHAKKVRPAQLAEQLFWSFLDHLQRSFPQHAKGPLPGSLRKFRRTIQIIDSTVIELVANSLDVGAKPLPRPTCAWTWRACCTVMSSWTSPMTVTLAELEKCVPALKDGEIVVFDRANKDWKHLKDVDQRGVFWVGREKKGTAYNLLDFYEVTGGILEDEQVMLNEGLHALRITAWVEVDDQRRQMTFLTNNFKWSARTVCDLYKPRWQIEVFFKQIKQTLKLSDFSGHSASVVCWKVWTAMLVYVLLRFLSRMRQWTHRFVRLVACRPFWVRYCGGGWI